MTPAIAPTDRLSNESIRAEANQSLIARVLASYKSGQALDSYLADIDDALRDSHRLELEESVVELKRLRSLVESALRLRPQDSGNPN